MRQRKQFRTITWVRDPVAVIRDAGRVEDCTIHRHCRCYRDGSAFVVKCKPYKPSIDPEE